MRPLIVALFFVVAGCGERVRTLSLEPPSDFEGGTQIVGIAKGGEPPSKFYAAAVGETFPIGETFAEDVEVRIEAWMYRRSLLELPFQEGAVVPTDVGRAPPNPDGVFERTAFGDILTDWRPRDEPSVSIVLPQPCPMTIRTVIELPVGGDVRFARSINGGRTVIIGVRDRIIEWSPTQTVEILTSTQTILAADVADDGTTWVGTASGIAGRLDLTTGAIHDRIEIAEPLAELVVTRSGSDVYALSLFGRLLHHDGEKWTDHGAQLHGFDELTRRMLVDEDDTLFFVSNADTIGVFDGRNVVAEQIDTTAIPRVSAVGRWDGKIVVAATLDNARRALFMRGDNNVWRESMGLGVTVQDVDFLVDAWPDLPYFGGEGWFAMGRAPPLTECEFDAVGPSDIGVVVPLADGSLLVLDDEVDRPASARVVRFEGALVELRPED